MSSRRQFIRVTASGVAGLTLGAVVGRPLCYASAPTTTAPWFNISLAQWSLHRALSRGRLDHLDFITQARRTYGIGAVEYVNTFFFKRARDRAYLGEMKARCDGEDVRSVLIMCDNEGRLGDPKDKNRREAIDNHHKWVEAAAFLGCHSIRVNAASKGSWEEQSKLAADGLHRLATYGDEHGINVLVENHGGLSSNGRWLAETIQRGDHPRLGTLPDFGNFKTGGKDSYDRYQGVQELMGFAKAVSAKSHDFGAAGDETEIDYLRMLRIVRDAGYRSWVGIEYEGDRLPEPDGIRATKSLLERVRTELAEDVTTVSGP